MLAARPAFTRQTVYRYFPSRPALIDAVVERREQLLLKGLEAEFTEADTLADALRAGVRMALGILRSGPQLDQRPGDLIPQLTIERAGIGVRRMLADRVGRGIPPHTVESAGDIFIRLLVSYSRDPHGLADRQIADRITAMVLPALSTD